MKQSLSRTRFLPWPGVVAACGILAGAALLLSPRHERPSPQRSVDAASPAGASRASKAPKSEAERALARTDSNIAFHRRRAEKRGDSWLDWDTVATTYLQRARLTGSYDDYRAAEAAVARSFSVSTGSGSIKTRAQINFTLHRFDRVEPDLALLEANPLRRSDVQGWAQETRAELAVGRGNYAEARRIYEELLGSDRAWSTLISYGLLLAKTGEIARGEQLLEEAAHIPGPRNTLGYAWLQLQRGLLDLERGRYDEALRHYQTGRDGFDGWYLIDEHIAEIEAIKGELDPARIAYEDLVRRTGKPEFMDALGEVLLRLGRPEDAGRWHDRARDAYQALLKDYPEAAYGHALEHFLEFETDAAMAVNLAEKNRDLRPGAEAQTLLARAYLKAGRLDAARDVVGRVLQTPFRTVDFLVTATRVYELSGDDTSAQTTRAAAQRINPHAFP